MTLAPPWGLASFVLSSDLARKRATVNVSRRVFIVDVRFHWHVVAFLCLPGPMLQKKNYRQQNRRDETERVAPPTVAIAVEIGTKCGTTSWTGFPSAVLMLIGLRARGGAIHLGWLGSDVGWDRAGLGPETAGTDLGVSRLDWKWGLVSEFDGAIRGNVFTRRWSQLHWFFWMFEISISKHTHFSKLASFEYFVQILCWRWIQWYRCCYRKLQITQHEFLRIKQSHAGWNFVIRVC